jgi:hypothetical protein
LLLEYVLPALTGKAGFNVHLQYSNGAYVNREPLVSSPNHNVPFVPVTTFSRSHFATHLSGTHPQGHVCTSSNWLRQDPVEAHHAQLARFSTMQVPHVVCSWQVSRGVAGHFASVP